MFLLKRVSQVRTCLSFPMVVEMQVETESDTENISP